MLHELRPNTSLKFDAAQDEDVYDELYEYFILLITSLMTLLRIGGQH